MQTIQFDIEDSKLDAFLTLMENLKEGMIKNLSISHDNSLDEETKAYMKTPQFQKDKAILQQRLADIESGKTSLISHDDMWNKIAQHTNNV